MVNATILLQSRNLSPREKEQLVDKLLACRTMRNRTPRDQVVQELSFANSIDRASSTTNKDDVMTIISRCLDFSDGLHQLIERIEFREENSQPMSHLGDFLQILLSSPQPIMINIDSVAKLNKIINGIQIPKEKLHLLYRQTNINNGQIPRRDKNLDEDQALPFIVKELVLLGQQFTSQNELTHPLFTFIKLLAHQVPNTIKEALFQWLVEAAEKEQIPLSDIHIIDRASEPISQGAHYLLVKFKPCNEKKGIFEIHSWLIYEQINKITPIYVNTNEETSFVGIPLVIDELISRCEDYTDKFTIELFLPFTLLNCDKSETDVHEWKLDAGFGNTIKLSHKYPLVLRSYERIYEINKLKPWVRNRLKQAWINNWATYKNCREGVLKWSLKEQESYKENLVGWLQEVACLAMLFTPPTFNDAQPHIFKKMLSAGTCVALWPRLYSNHIEEEVIEQAYHNLLGDCYYSNLPKALWERRKAASLNAELPANHLTLFWDNPYRLPSDAPQANVQDKYPLAFPRERK